MAEKQQTKVLSPLLEAEAQDVEVEEVTSSETGQDESAEQEEHQPEQEPQKTEEESTEQAEAEQEAPAGFESMEFSSEEEEEEEEEGEEGEEDTGEGGQQVPDEVSQDQSKFFADFLLNIYCSEFPKFLHKFSNIPENKVSYEEYNGKVAPGSTDYVREINKNNKGNLKVTSDQKKYIKQPLEQVLQRSGTQLSPEVALVIAVVVVSVMLFFQASQIKKDNQEIINELFEINKKYHEEKTS